jgi:hypothetical protein
LPRTRSHCCGSIGQAGVENANHRRPRLLCLRRHRPNRRAAESRDEVAANPGEPPSRRTSNLLGARQRVRMALHNRSKHQMPAPGHNRPSRLAVTCPLMRDADMVREKSPLGRPRKLPHSYHCIPQLPACSPSLPSRSDAWRALRPVRRRPVPETAAAGPGHRPKNSLPWPPYPEKGKLSRYYVLLTHCVQKFSQNPEENKLYT